jgi:hypothetical protein
MNIRVALKPVIFLGFVGVKIVENEIELCVRVEGQKFVHKFEEFNASTALFGWL